ncbi:MAG: hypothetical protein JXA62_09235 [Candidatus Aminicenantes bacterium]|nr:hypothetical protein [Candidatus Aminicenantes bacterium]
MKLLKWTGLGICIFVFLDHLVFMGLRYAMVQIQNDISRQSDHLLRQLRNDQYDALIMGSSRSFHALLPIHFSELMGLNALQVSLKRKYPRYHYHFYRLYRERFQAPRYVFYGTDFHMFSIRSASSLLRNLIGDSAGVRPMPLPEAGKNPLLEHISWLLHAKPLFEEFLQELLETAPGPFREDPLLSTYRGRTDNQVNVTRPEKRFRKIPYTPFPGKEGEYLVRLLQDLNHDGVQVYMVMLPDHIGTYASLRGTRQYHKDIRNLSARFTNVECLDFHDPETFPLQRADFFADGGWGKGNSHLSANGARKLAELIRERKFKASVAGNPIGRKP